MGVHRRSNTHGIRPALPARPAHPARPGPRQQKQAEGIEPATPTDARYARVARELECSELEARKICVAYNALPTESRGMFQAVHVRQRELAQAARELGLELAAARLHLDEALEALCPTRPC